MESGADHQVPAGFPPIQVGGRRTPRRYQACLLRVRLVGSVPWALLPSRFPQISVKEGASPSWGLLSPRRV